ncbi:MAG: thioredoxin family protein [bacterium]
MKGLFLVCILFLFIGCHEKMPKEKAWPIPQQTVKSEELSKIPPGERPEPPSQQTVKSEGLPKMPSGERPEPSPQQTIKQEGIEWLLFENGLKRAKAENKPLMVHFTADWCSWCKKLEAETFKNQEVISLSKSFVSVKVDCDKEIEIARKFQVRGLPTILFISPEGNVIHQVIGYRPTEAFLSEMKTALSKSS